MNATQNDFLTLLATSKKEIDTYLISELNKKQKEYKQHFWAEDVFDYLIEFVTKGKTVRGALMFQLLPLFNGKKATSEVVYLAALVEMIHAGLLIHDDFMDNDTKRRGMPSLYHKYQKFAQKNKLENDHLFGISLATCVADICFFIAFEQLAKLTVSKEIMVKIHQFIGKEYVHVGLAQMRDTHLGYLHNGTSLWDIETVNLFKTARYTFSMPFGFVALFLNLSEKDRTSLELAGEQIGILFQIRDDYLSLFGDSKVMGKPVGSDIIEDKKTLYRHFLFEALEKKENQKYKKVKKLFGKETLKKSEIALVQQTITELKIDARIEKINQEYKQKLSELLEKSSLTSKVKNFLLTLSDFVVTRNK